NNATFIPDYQEPQTPTAANGWFNPRGSADFRLLGCRVTGAWLSSGEPAAADDIVRSVAVADSNRRAAAKLVDLDPEQQLASAIWGLEVRVCTSGGATLLRGRFEPAAFLHIWDRAQQPAPGDILAGAEYQSVLTDLEWSDVSKSLVLRELKSTSSAGAL